MVEVINKKVTESFHINTTNLTHARLTMATYLNLEFNVSQRCSIFFVLCLLLFFLQCYGYETGEGLHAKKYMFILSWFLCVL